VPTSGSPVDNTSAAPCALPTTVSTEDAAVPPGLTASSNESDPVYTAVKWTFGSGAGDLSATTLQPGQTYTIRYLAAVPSAREHDDLQLVARPRRQTPKRRISTTTTVPTR
jgi:hypothetical protein